LRIDRLLLASVLALVAPAVCADTPPAGFKVIANMRVPGTRIPRDTLARVFLGQVSRWGGGSLIEAIDLSSTSTVRQAFSTAVLGMPVEAVRNHWLRLVLSGRRPPMTKGSDAEVIAFVAANPGAVGYVSEKAEIPRTVHVVEVQGDPGVAGASPER
jgi:hypothetical protein